MVNVNVAKHAGFCFGVRDAYEMALEASEKHQNVVMLGEIVHNEAVVKRIDDAGVKVIKSLDVVQPTDTLLLRAHGSVPEVYKEAQERGLNVIDATCHLVLEIHQIARQLAQDGYQLVIIGDHNHDEVRGIAGQVQNSIIIAQPQEVPDKIKKRYKKIGVVVQSTQNIDNAKLIVAELAARCGEMKFVDTICGPTKAYQKEIRIIPQQNDVMIIVGSFTSANTCRLTEISRKLNPRTHQVASESELQQAWFENTHEIGVSAGASTPDWVIETVVKRIHELVGITETECQIR